MKVVEKGKKKKADRTHQWSCRECCAVIESSVKEGNIVYDQRDGNTITFICPECGEKNWIGLSLFK